MNEPFARGYFAERGIRWSSAGGRRLTQLGAVRYCETCRNAVNAFLSQGKTLSFAPQAACQNDLRDQTPRELVNRRFRFQKGGQLFIGADDETLPSRCASAIAALLARTGEEA